jgi:hypothetical protein
VLESSVGPGVGAMHWGKEKGHEGGGSGLGRVEFDMTWWQIPVNISEVTRASYNLETRMRF